MGKILLFDLETAPMVTYNWGLYQELNNTSFVKTDWFVLCWCAKWLGDKKVMSGALPDYKGYKRNPTCDKKMMQDLWNLLDEADIVIAHNATKFDVKKANARFVMNGMKPPSPYKVVDTLTIARSKFKFTSNRLNDLGQYLKVGKKVDTGGFQLWIDCMAGKKSAWNKMVKYCKQDVVLLEKVYLILRPFHGTHPNMGVYVDDDNKHCPKCSSTKLQKRGRMYTGAGEYQRYQCKCCGGWSRGKKNLRNNKVNNTN